MKLPQKIMKIVKTLKKSFKMKKKWSLALNFRFEILENKSRVARKTIKSSPKLIKIGKTLGKNPVKKYGS